MKRLIASLLSLSLTAAAPGPAAARVIAGSLPRGGTGSVVPVAAALGGAGGRLAPVLSQPAGLSPALPSPAAPTPSLPTLHHITSVRAVSPAAVSGVVPSAHPSAQAMAASMPGSPAPLFSWAPNPARVPSRTPAAAAPSAAVHAAPERMVGSFKYVRSVETGVGAALSASPEAGLLRLMDGAQPSVAGGFNAVAGNAGAVHGFSPLSAGSAYLPSGRQTPVPEKRPEYRPRAINSWFRMWDTLLYPILSIAYRIYSRGTENLPTKGGALLLPNHVSWLDVLLISHAAKRPVRFLMYKPYYDSPYLHWFVKGFEPIPLVPGDPAQVEWALAEARRAMEAGDTVAIFPEGSFTENGTLKRFKRGLETIAKDSKVPVIPVHLDGLWGSWFSKKQGTSFWHSLFNIGRRLTVRFGAPLAGEVNVDTVRDAVEQLSAVNMRERVLAERKPLGVALVESAFQNWGRPAMSDSTGVSLTYGEMLAGAKLLADQFGPALDASQNVGLFMPSSVGGAISNAAVALLGKTAVNLNYTASSDALRQSMAQAEVKTVITSRRFMSELAKRTGRSYDLGPDVIYLEDVAPRIPKWKKALTFVLMRVLGRWLTQWLLLPRATARMEDDATIIPTSGSTAFPKAVRLSHLNVQSNIKMMEELFAFKKTDVMLGILPFFHSFGFTETLWMAILNGIHAVYHANPFETDEIDALGRQFKPTILLGTPTFLRRYAQTISKEAFAAMRLVVAGAEKLYIRDAKSFNDKFGITPLEGYGATETAPVSAVSVPDVYKDRNGEKVIAQDGRRDESVGRPPPGVAIRIVDPETGAFLGADKPGHILIKGPHVMPGYYGDAARTAEALKDGWYYTGDIGTRDRDGFLFITGRISRFSKIGGEMVSHGLVEEKLQDASGQPERRFAVAGAPDARMGEKLIVLYTDFGATPEELLAKVGDSLGGVSKPRAVNFFKIAEFPMLGSGKLDLKAVAELALKLDAERLP
ncbi:MAG: AMP-binding protein [Elusimicrobia bacterium]|nr:AMP-binding protein [Elusimicrobiota bacterium]